MAYVYQLPYGSNYNYGMSPNYKDEGPTNPDATYRHQEAMYKLMPAGEALLDQELVEV